MMVNLVADNEKLRGRAARMIKTISGVSDAVAAASLDKAGGAVKPAVLMAGGAPSLQDATALLERHNGHLGAALAHLADA